MRTEAHIPTKAQGLSYHQLHLHLWECGVGVVDLSMTEPLLQEIIIRGKDSDFYLASIHRDGDTLIFDIGQEMPHDG